MLTAAAMAAESAADVGPAFSSSVNPAALV